MPHVPRVETPGSEFSDLVSGRGDAEINIPLDESAEIEILRRSLGKAVTDYVFVLLSGPMAVPTLLILVLIIKLNEPKAPAFYTQTRYGIGGKPFTIYKLRTMVPNADKLKDGLLELSEEPGPGFKIENDPRITKFGSSLRKTHLDELPQLLNVLTGDMSLVGPRANSYPLHHYQPNQLKRLSVLPGITGSWQIAQDKPKDFAARCQMDIDYVDNNSFLGDLKILMMTFRTCLFLRTGA